MPNDKLTDNKSFQNPELGRPGGGFSEDMEFAWQRERRERAHPAQRDVK